MELSFLGLTVVKYLNTHINVLTTTYSVNKQFIKCLNTADDAN